MANLELGNELVGHEEADKQLAKTLSFQDLFFLSMSAIIGSGWLLAVLAANQAAGPAVILSWIIGGILVLFIAINYAEVAGMLPRSGAIVRYPHLTHGSYLGYVLAWTYFLSAVTIPTIEAEAVVTYASSYLPALHLTSTNGVLIGWGIVFAIILTLIFFIVNYFGIRFLGTVNTVITWWKFIVPTLTFILLFFVFRGSNFTAYGGFAPLGVPNIFLAIATTGIIFSYLGFRQALDYAGEARNPQRDVPRATILSVVAAIILYTLLQLSFTGAIRWGTMGIHPGAWALLKTSTWADAPFRRAFLAAGNALFVAFAVLLTIDAYISPGGTGWVYLGTSARTIYGIAMDGYLPPVFARINPRFRVPLVALAVSLVISWLVLLPLPSWYALVGFISSATVLTYIMGGVGLQVLRRTAPELHRPFRLGGAAFWSPIGFIAAALIVYWSGITTLNGLMVAVLIGLPLYAWIYAPRHMGVNPLGGAIAGILMLAAIIVTAIYGPASQNVLSFPVYFLLLLVETLLFSVYMWFATVPEKRHEIIASAWFYVLVFGLYLLSEYGVYGPLTKPLIAFPWDTIIAAVFALAIYFWAVSSGYKTPEIEAIIAAEGPGSSASPDVAPAS